MTENLPKVPDHQLVKFGRIKEQRADVSSRSLGRLRTSGSFQDEQVGGVMLKPGQLEQTE